MLLGLRHVTTSSEERFIQEFAGSAHVCLRHAFFPPVESPATPAIAPNRVKNSICLTIQIEVADVLVCQFPNGVVTGSLGLLSPPSGSPRGHGGQVSNTCSRETPSGALVR